MGIKIDLPSPSFNTIVNILLKEGDDGSTPLGGDSEGQSRNYSKPQNSRPNDAPAEKTDSSSDASKAETEAA